MRERGSREGCFHSLVFEKKPETDLSAHLRPGKYIQSSQMIVVWRCRSISSRDIAIPSFFVNRHSTEIEGPCNVKSVPEYVSLDEKCLHVASRVSGPGTQPPFSGHTLQYNIPRLNIGASKGPPAGGQRLPVPLVFDSLSQLDAL